MFRSIFLRRACSLVLQTDVKGLRPILVFTKIAKVGDQECHCRFLCQSPENKNLGEQPVPEAPPLTPGDIGFMEELSESDDYFKQNKPKIRESTEMPEAPNISPDWDICTDEIDENMEDVEDLDAVSFIPPFRKFVMLPGSNHMESPNLIADSESTDKAFLDQEINPVMQQVLAAWARAVIPTPATGPMPLHELANRTTKIKELVKLGVDFSQIVKRHGDLEQLLHRDWEDELKPQIRFLINCGIDIKNLGMFFTCNTPLLWTDKDDIQVRINYLEAKHFTQDQIQDILNRAPYWLTLSTKELDRRLGFIQKTFGLQGSDVRYVASKFPRIVSGKKWDVFVDTTKRMDREFGFTPWERKELLMKKAVCYTRPSLVRAAFDFCHHQIGMTHTQLVQHASLLVNRVNRLKPRHEFLKFLKRDVFKVDDPLYISPDWLWQGTTEEFCEQAAKSTVEEFDNYLKYSAVL